MGFCFGQHPLVKELSGFASGSVEAAEMGCCVRHLVLRCGPFLEFICKDLDTLTLLFLKASAKLCHSERFCIYLYVPVVNFCVANFFV